MNWKPITESEGCQRATALDLLCKKDAEQLRRLAIEYRTLCESAAKYQSGKFLDISKTKLALLKKFLAGLCEKDGVVKESFGENASTLSKGACRRIMELVMAFAWNCWDMGGDQFPWEDAKRDHSLENLDGYLNSLVLGGVTA